MFTEEDQLGADPGKPTSGIEARLFLAAGSERRPHAGLRQTVQPQPVPGGA